MARDYLAVYSQVGRLSAPTHEHRG
jgi:hypothetical protein